MPTNSGSLNPQGENLCKVGGRKIVARHNYTYRSDQKGSKLSNGYSVELQWLVKANPIRRI